MISRIGIWFVNLSLVITLNLYLLSKPSLDTIFNNPFLSLSQIISLLGTVLLSVTFVLSGRFRFLEKYFGGLDRIYHLHHLYGGIAFVLLVHHPVFLAFRLLPKTSGIGTYFLLGNNLIYNAGIVALYLLALMLIFTLLINLPYHIWLLTHQLLGFSLIFASLHIFFISSDVSRYFPLRLWVLSWLSVAIVSFFYKKFIYPKYRPKFDYLIDHISRSGDFTQIIMKPSSKSLSFYPGQFAFFTFHSSTITTESHPFSFASNNQLPTIRICVKSLGDFTSKISALKPGDKVTIHGPYGQFGVNFYGTKDIVAIAGGVGITPFLSLLNSPQNQSTARKINLFYTSKSQSLALDHKALEKLSDQNFIYHPWFSDQKSTRLTAADIKTHVDNFNNCSFYLCGPYQMMMDIRDQLFKLGIRQRNIHFEDFNLK